jgi:hypothetical protein
VSGARGGDACAAANLLGKHAGRAREDLNHELAIARAHHLVHRRVDISFRRHAIERVDASGQLPKALETAIRLDHGAKSLLKQLLVSRVAARTRRGGAPASRVSLQEAALASPSKSRAPAATAPLAHTTMVARAAWKQNGSTPQQPLPGTLPARGDCATRDVGQLARARPRLRSGRERCATHSWVFD